MFYRLVKGFPFTSDSYGNFQAKKLIGPFKDVHGHILNEVNP